MKTPILLINFFFVLALVGCNGAEFAGSRNKSVPGSPPVVICDDDKGCDPGEDPKNPGTEEPNPCDDGSCEEEPDPCDELFFEDYDRFLEECEIPCEGSDCDEPGDKDPVQNDDPSQNSDDDPSQR